jgi:hypothetical protein
MWLDFAEDQARRRQQVFLRDWQTRLDQFLQFNDRDVLEGQVKSARKRLMKRRVRNTVSLKKQRLLKEAEGEKDIVGLLKWDKQAKR